jgi:hypothetical protein
MNTQPPASSEIRDTTKSRRYSVTMGALRDPRATWARQQAGKDSSPQHHSPHDLTEQSDEVWWEFDHAGHAIALRPHPGLLCGPPTYSQPPHRTGGSPSRSPRPTMGSARGTR